MKLRNARRFALIPFLAFLALVISHHAIQAAAVSVTTVSVPMGGQAMAARTDAMGTIHLVFDSPDGPHYVSSGDNGQTFSEPIALVDSASKKPGLEFITWDMAVTANGAVHVVLGNNAWKLKLPRDEWGVFYTRRLPAMPSFAPLRNINRKPSEGFSLAVAEEGTVTAVWMADKLFANVSHDEGETFAAAVEVDPVLNPCNCCTTSSVYGADGRLAILYREETNNERDMYLALWDQKKNAVTKTRVSTTPWKVDACPMTYYTVTRDGDGYLAAWPTKGQIYFARLDGNGSAVSPKEIKTPGMNGMRTGIQVMGLAGGWSLVAWKKDSQLGWQLYDDQGQPSGPSGSAMSAGSGVAGVLAQNGSVVLFK